MTTARLNAAAEHWRHGPIRRLSFETEAILATMTAHAPGVVPDPLAWLLIRAMVENGYPASLTMCHGSYDARLPTEMACRVCGHRVVRAGWFGIGTTGGFVPPHERSEG